MIKWIVIIALMVLLFLLWPQITKAGIKNAVIEVLGTDEQGRKIIKVTGTGGADDGKSVQGYELPRSIKENQFPFTVIVAPNQKLFGYFGIGEKITFSHPRKNAVIWRGTIGDAGGEYIIDYPLLKQTAVGFIEN